MVHRQNGRPSTSCYSYDRGEEDQSKLYRRQLWSTCSGAHRWRRRIESGQARSITDLAEQEGVTDAYVCRLLPLTCLVPDIVEALLDGRQPNGLRVVVMLGNGAARLERAEGDLGLQQLTRTCSGRRSTAVIRCRAFDWTGSQQLNGRELVL